MLKIKQLHPDQKYITALLENNTLMINEIYKNFVPKVIAYVCKNSGDEMAANDIVQETLITIYDQAKTKELQLSCPFDAYFFLICKRKWLNILKKESNKGVTIEDDRLYISDDTDEQVQQSEDFEEQQQLYITMLSKIGETCKNIITLGFSKMSMQEVADHLGITYAYARKKKSICLTKLTELIKTSPKYKRLKNL